jgi:hypothetical protein
MRSIPGLTSFKVQKLINQICSAADSYLEIGCYLGATAAGALDGNKLTAYFVDNWKENVQPFNAKTELPENSKELFIKTAKAYKGENSINIFECDMFDVDLAEIKVPIDVFLYDADHDKDVTAKAIEYYSSVFANTCVMLIDDANFEGVVEGAHEGIANAGLNITYSRLLLNDIEDPEEWWNGLYIIVVNK